MNTTNENRKISVIIPVYNEIETINPLIEHLFRLASAYLHEIIVVDGDPEQKTGKIITDKRVVITGSDKGRARQMNKGAALSGGDVLIFLHADTLLPGNAFQKINSVMKTSEYVGGAFELGIDSDKTILKLIGRATTLRSRLTRIPYGDQAIFIDKDYFFKIGGFKDIPLLEDIELMERIKKDQKAIYIVNERVTTSSRRWEDQGVIKVTLKNQMINFGYALGFSPESLAKIHY